MILATILAGCVTEVILEGNIRRMFKGMAQTIMAIAVVVLTFVIYRGDLLGFDSFVPDADKVESCAFETFSNSFNYYDTVYGRSYEFDSKEYMEITDVEDFIAVAKAGMKTQCEVDKASRDGKYLDIGYQLGILYRMKSGKKIYRQITIPYDEVDESLDRIVSGSEYKMGAFEVFHDEALREVISAAGSKTLRYYTATNSSEVRDFDYSEVSDAYRQDVLSYYNFREMKDKMPVASIEVEVNGESSVYGKLEVFDNYSNTISLMKKYGIYSDSEVDLHDIQKVTVTNYYPGHDMDIEDYEDVPDDVESQSAEYTEPEDIKAILDAAVPTDFYNQWYNYNNNNSGYSIEVTVNGEMYSGAYYTFLKGKVPGFVEEDTNR